MNPQEKIDQLKQITEDILVRARRHGASNAAVHCMAEEALGISVRMGKQETLESSFEQAMGVDVYFGKKSGSVAISAFDAKSIENAVSKACEIARFTEEDPYAGLADAELMAQHPVDLDLYHPWEISPQAAVEMLLECENTARALDSRIVNSEGVGLGLYKTFRVYGNSHGFLEGFPATQYTMDCCLIAEVNGAMERDYSRTVSRESIHLKKPSVLAEKTVERTVARLGARPIKTQKIPVIFDERLSRGLMRIFLNAIAGSNLYRKNSFLLDAVNTLIFPESIDIYEDPLLPKRLGSFAFDEDGVATYRKSFVEQGVLKSYALDTYSARQLGLKTTANAGGISNLFVKTDTVPFSNLLARMDRGIYVTELFGEGVHLVTGDFSQGAFGYWVSNGEIQYPVSGITISGNLRDLCKSIVAVG
ncbi:MAG: metalloprotease PmbA, partial [Gammaproteobacteria bacterium]|nr:metalloprotease PmbA [Gammaproteobacteria bacterium]